MLWLATFRYHNMWLFAVHALVLTLRDSAPQKDNAAVAGCSVRTIYNLLPWDHEMDRADCDLDCQGRSRTRGELRFKDRLWWSLESRKSVSGLDGVTVPLPQANSSHSQPRCVHV